MRLWLGLACAAIAGTALAADSFPPLKRKELPNLQLGRALPVGIVKESHISFAPGQPSGLHLHPVPVVGVVTNGRFQFQPQGQPIRTLNTGDTFYEPANTRILHFDNASTSDEASITAFYLARTATDKTIVMLKR